MQRPDDALSPAERERLVNILARLGSDFDGERASAALLAHRMLRAKGLGWHEVITAPALPYQRPPSPPSPRPRAAPSDVRADLELCGRNFGLLSEWEAAFVVAVARLDYEPTARQAAKVHEIAQRLRAKQPNPTWPPGGSPPQ